MATFSINCPHCGGTLEVQDEWAGMETACPLCSKAFIVPRREIPVPPPVSQPPAGGYCQVEQPASGPVELPKLYNPNSAASLSLIFSPLFGSWCIWQNYKTLGDSVRALRSLIWTIIIAVIYLLLTLIALGGKSVSGGWLILLIVWWLAEELPQEKMLKKRAASLGVDVAYSRRSFFHPVLIGIAAIPSIGLVITIIEIFKSFR